MATKTIKKATTRKTTSNVTKKSTNKKTVTKTKTKTTKKVEKVNDEFYATVGRLALKNITDLVSEALPSKEFNDAKNGIFIETRYEDDNPMLYMTANSLNVFISYGIPLQEEIGEGFVIPKGKDFRNIVRGLQNFDSPIDLSFDEEENVFTISCGDDYEGTIQHYDAEGFVFPPTLDEIKEHDVIKMPVKFIQEALDKVAFSCSNDMTIPELTGVLIEQTKDAINIVGADGVRFSYLTIKSKVKNPKKVIVGVKYLSLFNSILKSLEIKSKDTLTLYLSEDKLFFNIDNLIIGIQIFAGDYPIVGGYEQFVIDPDECDVSIKFDKDAFIEKLDLAVLHNNSTLDPIVLLVKDNKCKFKETESSENKFSIDFEAIENDNDEDTILIDFTPSFIYDVLRCIDNKEFLLSLQDITSGPAIVTDPKKGNEYIHVFSLN